MGQEGKTIAILVNAKAFPFVGPYRASLARYVGLQR